MDLPSVETQDDCGLIGGNVDFVDESLPVGEIFVVKVHSPHADQLDRLFFQTGDEVLKVGLQVLVSEHSVGRQTLNIDGAVHSGGFIQLEANYSVLQLPYNHNASIVKIDFVGGCDVKRVERGKNSMDLIMILQMKTAIRKHSVHFQVRHLLAHSQKHVFRNYVAHFIQQLVLQNFTAPSEVSVEYQHQRLGHQTLPSQIRKQSLLLDVIRHKLVRKGLLQAAIMTRNEKGKQHERKSVIT